MVSSINNLNFLEKINNNCRDNFTFIIEFIE